ncbi:hypothetical protein GDO78_018906 [Eleutherodactylus coqui]|uniref:Ig-like domain-containing protein n=1 Tax=Eleutherodactylus coqui TaxID=57060 RepID=A0A8J6EAW1_ELECQ|nr:hypothetical protein GDO78_018906 [Eleutherodactylus coqui]
MVSRSYLLAVIFISIQGSCGEITVTVSPDYIAMSPGDTVTFSCTSSTGVSNHIAWYQLKPGQPPKLLIRYATTRQPGVPERFSGSGSGTNYKLTITRMTKDDAAHYYCQQYYSFPLTQ